MSMSISISTSFIIIIFFFTFLCKKYVEVEGPGGLLEFLQEDKRTAKLA